MLRTSSCPLPRLPRSPRSLLLSTSLVLVSLAPLPLAAAGCGTPDLPITSVSAPVGSAPASATQPPPAPRARAEAPKAPIALEEYFKTKRVSGLSFSHDEKRIAFISDEGGRLDLYVRPLTGGPATQITKAQGFVHSFRFSPKDDRLAYELDDGGDELPRLYLTNAKGDAPAAVVPDLPKGRRTRFVEWSPDGTKLTYLSNARDERAMDLYEFDVTKKATTVLWKAEGNLSFHAISADGKRFAIAETKSDADNNVYLVERASADKKTLLTPHEGAALHEVQAFARDGQSLLITSNAEGEFTTLVSLDLATKKQKTLRKENWDVELGVPSASGRYLVSASNVDGVPKIVVNDVRANKEVTLPPAPKGGAFSPWGATRSGTWFLGFSRSERYFAVNLLSDTTPASPHVIDLKERKIIAVAEPLPASLAGHEMVAGTSVQIPSFDGRSVPAYLYAPKGAGPFPAVIDVHGGPTAQSRRTFSPMRQYLVSKGYVVLVPNVRGSTGYGKTWTQLDNLDLGGGPLKDIVACKKYMVAKANVAEGRVVVMGGSYGGYMALAAAAFTPDEFVANVDYFGVSDLKSLVESFPPYWASFASYIYKKFGDPKNPEHATYQHDRSPVNFVSRIKRPLLVVQGEKDARVKTDQSERIVKALKGSGVAVHYLLLPGEGHGFSKNENILKVSLLTDRFLDRYVFGDETVRVD